MRTKKTKEGERKTKSTNEEKQMIESHRTIRS
jgi:hypothetical protein